MDGCCSKPQSRSCFERKQIRRKNKKRISVCLFSIPVPFGCFDSNFFPREFYFYFHIFHCLFIFQTYYVLSKLPSDGASGDKSPAVKINADKIFFFFPKGNVSYIHHFWPLNSP